MVTRPLSKLLVLLLGLTGSGVLIAAALPFSAVRESLDAVAGDGSAEPYTPELHRRVTIYLGCLGVALLLVAAWLAWDLRSRNGRDAWLTRLARDGQSLGQAGLREWRDHRRTLLALALVGVLIRLPYLDLPMRYDEAHSFVNYANWPVFVTVSTYNEPNNHIFHNVCVHIVTRMLGSAESIVRLPALIAGVLTIPAVFLLGLCWGGRGAGVVAALAVACSSPLIEYSVNARGYSLQGLLLVCLVLLARYSLRHDNIASWSLMSLLAALGFWTVPTMLYLYSLLITWSVLLHFASPKSAPEHGRFWRRLCAHCAATMLLTVALYSPVLVVQGTAPFVSSRFIVPLGWREFVETIPSTLTSTTSLLARDLPLVSAGLFTLGWLLVLRPSYWQRCRAPGLLLLSLGACFTLVAVQGVTPPPRIWTPLWPLLLTISCCGLMSLVAGTGPRTRHLITAALLLLLCVWPLFRMVQRDTVRQSRETGTFPDAEVAVLWLRDSLESREPIVTIVPSSAPLVYYALRHQLPLVHFEWPGSPNTRSDQAIVVVNTDWQQSVPEVLGALGLEEQFDTRASPPVLELASARLYRVRAAEAD